MNLIDRIEQAMLSDHADRDKQSRFLVAAYLSAKGQQDKAALVILDNAFIALCGYSLTTLVTKLNEEDDGDDEDESLPTTPSEGSP